MGELKSSDLSAEDAIELLSAWSFLGSAKVKATKQGTVNKTFFVEAQAGKFVLKVYNDSRSTGQIQYEHSLLVYLQTHNLSFVVPTPIPDDSGKTLLFVQRDDSLLRVTLQNFISGEPVDRQNINHIYAAARALGELHQALVNFDPQGELAQLPGWGDLKHIHPLVKNPLEVPHLLGLNSAQEQRIVKILTGVMEVAPKLYQTLPVQTIHGDYLCPNIFVENDRVVGILDFEFATSDLRLMDYIGAFDHFIRIREELPVWEKMKAFITGYDQHVSLCPSEVEALTSVWRLQQANCIVYWTGWLLEQKVTHQSVLDGVTKMLILEDWLKENGENWGLATGDWVIDKKW